MQVGVKVSAEARKKKVLKVDKRSYHITVREKAKGNAANMRIREILSLIYIVPIRTVRLLWGHRTGNKIIRIG